MIALANADSRHIPLADNTVQCVVTSPPYWGLRSYNTGDNKHLEIGAEQTPQAYVASIVAVMREVWRVLKDDGTVWLNLGDSYAGNSTGSDSNSSGLQGGKTTQREALKRPDKFGDGLKPKDLVGIPWRVVFALQDAGWYLRSDIIWHKPNPMPESVTDRPTKAHEYVFLLAKSERYYYDSEAILEKATMKHQNRFTNGRGSHDIGYNDHRKAPGMTAPETRNRRSVFTVPEDEYQQFLAWKAEHAQDKADVFKVATSPYSGAHYATFPPALVEPMILAGSKRGDIVLDPFAGSGTVGEVCRKYGRNFIGLDLSAKYLTDNAMPRAMQTNTAASMATLPMFAEQWV